MTFFYIFWNWWCADFDRYVRRCSVWRETVRLSSYFSGIDFIFSQIRFPLQLQRHWLFSSTRVGESTRRGRLSAKSHSIACILHHRNNCNSLLFMFVYCMIASLVFNYVAVIASKYWNSDLSSPTKRLGWYWSHPYCHKVSIKWWTSIH